MFDGASLPCKAMCPGTSQKTVFVWFNLMNVTGFDTKVHIILRIFPFKSLCLGLAILCNLSGAPGFKEGEGKQSKLS